MTDHLIVTTPSGRALRVHTAGDPAHPTVFVLHGSPSSGMLYPPNVEDAAAHGLRLVSYDRPGYGGSTPHPGRRVADAAADVGTIADFDRKQAAKDEIDAINRTRAGDLA